MNVPSFTRDSLGIRACTEHDDDRDISGKTSARIVIRGYKSLSQSFIVAGKMAFTTVAVAGATGTLGKPISQALVNKGFKVKIFTRDVADAKKKLDVKAEYVVVDYKNKSNLVAALQGVEVVISAVGGAALGEQILLIEAAKEAGVKRFYPGEFGGDPANGGKSVLFDVKRDIFEVLKKSGLEWTFIINGLFLEYLYSPFLGVDVANNKITFVGTKDTKLSYTALKDIGAFTAESINNPISKNAVIKVVGETISYGQIAETIEKSTGKKWDVKYTPVSDTEAKIAANPNPWATIPEQLLTAFGKGQGEVKNPQNKEFPAVKVQTLADFLKK